MSAVPNAAPGDIIVTNFGSYQHYSIVSDRCDANGQYMLISATSRTGTVVEEPFDTVTRGKKTYLTAIDSPLTIEQRLARARSQCQKWSYSLMKANCEHFAHWVSGEKAQSRQLKLVIRGASYGITIASFILKKPSPGKLALSVASSALFSLYKARATKKEGFNNNVDDEIYSPYGVDAV